MRFPLLRSTTVRPTSVLTLADLRAGDRARIGCVDCANKNRCERLLAYGLTQGQVVTLLQTSPAFVIRIDETELALDELIARCILVEPLR